MWNAYYKLELDLLFTEVSVVLCMEKTAVIRDCVISIGSHGATTN